MKTKLPSLAILQVADTGPLDSLVVMLNSVGIFCALPNYLLQGELRRLGCDSVLSVDDLVRSGSYDPPRETLPIVGPKDMERRDVLFVDIKAQKNHAKVTKRWPHLAYRQLWYRINGGKPEHVINTKGDHGDEVNPPCPVLTPNQWYGKGWVDTTTDDNKIFRTNSPCKSYSCWPPFVAINDYDPSTRWTHSWERPICLVHNVVGWGYGPLTDKFREMGVALHGERSPDGLLKHREVPTRLSKCLAYVHLKISDAPGYALYEALAAGCPVICTRKLIWKCRMQELLIPNVTCLVFDKETHAPFSTEDLVQCEHEVRQHLKDLTSPEYNERIGMAGRQQLTKIMWNEANDKESLHEFLTRHYGA